MINDVLDYHFEIINDGDNLTESFLWRMGYDIHIVIDIMSGLNCSFVGMVIKRR